MLLLQPRASGRSWSQWMGEAELALLALPRAPVNRPPCAQLDLGNEDKRRESRPAMRADPRIARLCQLG